MLCVNFHFYFTAFLPLPLKNRLMTCLLLITTPPPDKGFKFHQPDKKKLVVFCATNYVTALNKTKYLWMWNPKETHETNSVHKWLHTNFFLKIPYN